MQTSFTICDNNHVKIAYEGKECPLCQAKAALDDIGSRCDVLISTLKRLDEARVLQFRNDAAEQAAQ